MPDNDPSTNSHELPSEEDLDLVEQEKVVAEATAGITVNKVNTSVCARCGEPSVSFCSTCGQDFCKLHHCYMHEDKYDAFVVANDPLIDDEGTERKGRRIRLIGEGWPDHIRMIGSMTDEALEEQIKGLQQLLKDATAAQDFARICIAHAEFELEYRKHSRYVAAMKRREKIEQGAVRLGAKRAKATSSPTVQLGPDGKPIPPDVLATMQAFKITYQQAVALKTLLATAKKT